MIVDADDDRTLARHDLGGSTADPVGKGGDQRDLAGEPHRFPFRLRCGQCIVTLSPRVIPEL